MLKIKAGRFVLSNNCNEPEPHDFRALSVIVTNTLQAINLFKMSSARKLPKDLQKIAEEELNEVSTRIQTDIEHLLDWLSKQPHLKARKDDQSLLNFLRGSKFSLEKTKQRLEKYYTIKTMIPEFFENRDPFLPAIQEILSRGVVALISNKADPSCPIVITMSWGKTDPEEISVPDVIKVVLMAMDIAMNEFDSIVINGFYFLVDFQGMNNMYLLQATPAVLNKIALALLDMYPIRLKGDHHLNVPPLAEAMLNILKSFLKEKMKKRFYFYRDLGSIHTDIPLSVLPDEYGGTAGSLDEIAVEWKKKVESYKEWFLEDDSFRNDETKRLGKPKLASELTGVEGSFRLLQVD